MVTKWFPASLLVIAIATLTVGCSTPNDSATPAVKPSTTVTSTAAPTPTTTRVLTTMGSNFIVSAPTATSTASGSIPVKTGSISMRVWYGDDQVPMQDVAVRIQRVSPCDPAKKSIPATDAFVDQFQAVTDGDGTVSFSGIPLGCYHVTPDKEEGFSLLDSPGHGIFVTDAKPNVWASLQFAKDFPQCLPDGFADLPYFRTDVTTEFCDGRWAVVTENGNGDTTRLLQHIGGTWISYAAFPTKTCRSKAVSDNVPAKYLVHFDGGC